MSNEDLFAALRQSADPSAAAAIEEWVREAPDDRLSRVNVLAFAGKAGIDEERAVAAFLHAARLGAGPGVFGDIEQDPPGAVKFDLKVPDRFVVGLVHVMPAAEALELLAAASTSLNQHPEMM